MVPAGCTEIDRDDEDLLRQVHPTQVLNDGRPDSSAFSPSPRDAGRLSTRRESVGPQTAYEDWRKAGRDSAGTWGIRKGDFVDGLIAYDDSSEAGNPADHASVDFQGLNSSRHRKVGRRLRDASHDRGCLHLPEPTPAPVDDVQDTETEDAGEVP